MDGLIELLVVIVLIGIVAAGAVVAAGMLIGRVVVHEYERGVRMDSGRVIGLVGPGAITYLRPRTEVVVVDTRPVARAVDGQEVLTADGVAVKISLVVRTAVGDPVARLESDQDVDRFVYLLVQLGLREVVAGRELADVLAARTTIGAEIRDIAAGRLGEVGVELLSVDVRDVMVPPDLKRAQAAVITARAEGLASLERARAETASLRSLANAGKLLDDHPGLRTLRLVQELTARGGNTVVLGVPDAAGTVEVSGATATRASARARPGIAPQDGS
jgi:regulator of protease activity HflC (stomatin/prohibitin superfamily)